MTQLIPLPFALKIAHLLHIHRGLSRRMGTEFASAVSTQILPQYNFGGMRFWNHAGRWYVDRTSEPMETMINVKLAALKERLEAGKPASITGKLIWTDGTTTEL